MLCDSQLQFRLDESCAAVEAVVGGVAGVWIETEGAGATLMEVEPERWPEAECSKTDISVGRQCGLSPSRNGRTEAVLRET